MARTCWSFPALAQEVADARRAVVGFARANGADEPCLADLALAVSEAVSNAVLHAFRTRERPGTVTVAVEVTPHRDVEVVVRDDGMGLVPRDDSPGLGLGLALIERVVDQVEHREPPDGGGFELWMCLRGPSG